MRRLSVLVVALAVNSAYAEFKLCVDGATYAPETSVSVVRDESVMLGVIAFDELATCSGLIAFEGNGELDASGMWIVDMGLGSPPDRQIIRDASDDGDAMDYAEGLGLEPFGLFYFELMDASAPAESIPDGTVIDGIRLTCLGPGDLSVVLIDAGAGRIIDTQRIKVIPEPGTIVMLMLGALLAGRRR